MPETQPDTRPRTDPISMTPSQIARELSRHVIGQDAAVERMALLVRQHALHVGIRRASGPHGDPANRTPATLLVGSSGSGKTLLARRAAGLLDLPFASDTCAEMSLVGYAGKEVGSVVCQLLDACRGMIARAEAGSVVFMDEVDKVRRGGGSTFGGPDVSGEGVQRGLLSLAENAELQVQYQASEDRRPRVVTVRTFNMWLIMAGSFAAGLAGIIRRRLRGRRRRIGFGAGEGQGERWLREGELLAQVTEEDLIAFGMLPELIGRIPEIIVLNDLGPAELRRILTDCVDGPLQRAETLAAREGVEIRWTPRLLDRIAAEAYASGLGARSLSPVISRVTRRLMYELPDVVRRRSGSGMLLVELDEDALQDDGAYRVIRRRKEV